jgi:gas vesicle protein
MSSRDEAGTNVAFFILGGVIGAAAGILLAPRSGKETRAKLEDWLEAKRERSTELLAELKELSQEKREQIIAAAKSAKQAYAEAKHNHKDA